MPERIDFWGIPQPWGPALVYAVLSISALVMLARLVIQALRMVRASRPAARFDRPGQRLLRLLRQGLLQARTMRQRYAGIMHLSLSWAFGLLFLGTVLATINGHIFPFLAGSPYLVYKLVLDLAALAFLAGAGLALYRRYRLRPERLTLTRPFLVSLWLLAGIVLNGLLVEGLRFAILQPDWAPWAPAGWLVSRGWLAAGLTVANLHAWHQGMYGLHVLAVSAFFITLPTSTLLHLFSAPLAIYFSDLDADGARLAPLPNLQGVPAYLRTPQDLTWKQRLDGAACTECGRCQEACPAYAAGLPLDPKRIILSVRDAAAAGAAPALPGEAVTAGELWACMSCGACLQACPVLIEHVDLIVDLRRALLASGQVDTRLQSVLHSAAQVGNTASQPRLARSAWTVGLPFTIPDARSQPVDVLWWVGDEAAYDPELACVTRQTAEIFHAAGLDFGILYEAESNDGNDLRRAGEEGLFQALVRRNTAALKGVSFRRLVTGDPHAYNTFSHEYPADALQGRPVLHTSQLLDELVAGGRIDLRTKLDMTVTYHDPCYLGRYNQVYSPPRRLIAATGCRLVEMPHCRADAICCGAGGGRLWMDEGEQRERPSERRIREALALEDQPAVFAVACPKDRIMYADAVQNLAPGSLKVLDVVELVHEAMLES